MDEVLQIPPTEPNVSQVHVRSRLTFIVIAIVVLAVLLFLFGLILRSQKPKPTAAVNSVPSLTPSPTVIQSLTYVGSLYSLHYPSSWRLQTAVSTSGVQSILLRPKGQAEGTFTPNFAVDTYTASNAASVTEETNHYVSVFAFTKTAVTLDKKPASRFEGDVPLQFVNGDAVKKTTHNVLYVLSSGKYTFVLRYQYDKGNTDHDMTFQTLLNSFSVGQ